MMGGGFLLEQKPEMTTETGTHKEGGSVDLGDARVDVRQAGESHRARLNASRRPRAIGDVP